MEYRVVGHEVWLFYADGGEERFAVLEGPNGAALVARLLNENLARIVAERRAAEDLAVSRDRYEELGRIKAQRSARTLAAITAELEKEST